MYTHILIPTDGSELSQKAVEYGLALAKSVGAQVTVVTVSAPFYTLAIEPPLTVDFVEEYQKLMKQLSGKYLDSAKSLAIAAGVPCEVLQIEQDQPYLAIIDTAVRRSCDLIVMASHGRRGIAAIVLGSETVKVLTHSTIPVLVFRAARHNPLNVTS
jgi:nucleotide-binding universal stress UspA family protein